MERWRGRVAVVTGASAGIGAAIAYQLQDAGVNVVGLARRSDKIPEAVETARKDAKSRSKVQIGGDCKPGQLHCIKCDVTKEEDIIAAFKWVKENTNGVDILINNAGVIGMTPLSDSKKNTDEWKSMLDINVLGLSICTREAIQQMKARGVDDGHIIHIGSVAGHWMPMYSWPGTAIYFATKHAVRVLTEGLRKELVAAKSRIRVTEVSPGLVKTDIFNGCNKDVEEIFKIPHMFPEEVADAVLYAIQVPAHVQIHEIIIKPVAQDF
ncbi:hypothetical protein R5R35_009515 [Gryllus longicercus]|uniref:Dehydrogenase/reductase SDR family member 11 n=1 Tax=Gryllus longicercus TaxID=2509291 RepID=A0AAN9VI34_9ORTH